MHNSSFSKPEASLETGKRTEKKLGLADPVVNKYL
jgi:hypothetical protein